MGLSRADLSIFGHLLKRVDGDNQFRPFSGRTKKTKVGQFKKDYPTKTLSYSCYVWCVLSEKNYSAVGVLASFKKTVNRVPSSFIRTGAVTCWHSYPKELVIVPCVHQRLLPFVATTQPRRDLKVTL